MWNLVGWTPPNCEKFHTFFNASVWKCTSLQVQYSDQKPLKHELMLLLMLNMRYENLFYVFSLYFPEFSSKPQLGTLPFIVLKQINSTQIIKGFFLLVSLSQNPIHRFRRIIHCYHYWLSTMGPMFHKIYRVSWNIYWQAQVPVQNPSPKSQRVQSSIVRKRTSGPSTHPFT